MRLVDAFHPWVTRIPDKDVYVHTYPNDPDDAVLRGYFEACLSDVSKLNAPYTIVADLRELDSYKIGAHHRRVFSEFQQAMHEFDAKWCRGTSIVTISGFQRGLITAVYWLKPPVYEYALHYTVVDGIEYAKAQLQTGPIPAI